MLKSGWFRLHWPGGTKAGAVWSANKRVVTTAVVVDEAGGMLAATKEGRSRTVGKPLGWDCGFSWGSVAAVEFRFGSDHSRLLFGVGVPI